MKKITKNLLLGLGIAAVGAAAYILWDDYVQEQEQKVFAAAKRAEFIERRKAYARKKSAAAKAAEDEADQAAFTGDLSEAGAPACESDHS